MYFSSCNVPFLSMAAFRFSLYCEFKFWCTVVSFSSHFLCFWFFEFLGYVGLYFLSIFIKLEKKSLYLTCFCPLILSTNLSFLGLFDWLMFLPIMKNSFLIHQMLGNFSSRDVILFSTMVHYRILNIVPCAIYSKTLLFICWFTVLC